VLSTRPLCCRSAERGSADPVFAAVRGAGDGVVLSPSLLLGAAPPCRWDCDAARRLAPSADSAWLLYAEEGVWVLFERDGERVSAVFAEGPRWPTDGLLPGDNPSIDGRLLRRGERPPLDLSDRALLPLLLGPNGEGRTGASPSVVALDVRRSRADFTENTALRFAVGDLRRVGVPARLRLVETGLLGEGEGADEVAATVHADVVLVEDDALPGLGPALRARGVRTICLASPQRVPPSGDYDAVLPSWSRTAVLDALLGGPSPAGKLDVVQTGGAGRAPGAAWSNPALHWPAVVWEDADGALHPYARVAVVSNAGCPWSASASDNPAFDGVSLAPEQRSAGCTFCAQGGDYSSLPVADYPGWIAQQLRWLHAKAPTTQAVLGDEAGADVAPAVLIGFDEGELTGLDLLVKGRVERLARSTARIEAGIAEARRTGARLVLYLVGLENLSDAELLRFNKGVTAAQIEAVIVALDDLEAQHPDAFVFRRTATHGFLLFTPWTTLDDLAANLQAARRVDLTALAPKAPVSRLRLFDWQPLSSLAAHDDLSLDAWPDGTLRKHFGYKAGEQAWRFAHPSVGEAYGAVSRAWDRGARGADAWTVLDGAVGALRRDPTLGGEALDEAIEAAGREPALSPWIDTLKADVVQAARSLVGAPEQVEFRLRSVDGPGEESLGRLSLEVAAPGLPGFQLSLSDPLEGRGWVRGQRFRAEVSMAGGRATEDVRLRPLLEPLRRRLTGHCNLGSEAWSKLEASWQALRPFADIEDSHFRWVGPSGRGRRGMLRLGFRCNQDCSFCWQKRDWPEPPEEQFFTWLDEFGALGLDHLFISGGEPTTWKRLAELIERATSVHGMKVILQTNAIALSSSKVLGRLIDAGLASASVSLHAADAALSDAMTRAPGTFERTVRGIAACQNAGLPVHLTCVVERTNLPSLPAHANFIRDRFVVPFPDARPPSVAYAHPCLSIDRDAFAAACPSLDEVRGPLAEATRSLVAAGVSVTSVGGCGFPACALHDAPDLLVRLSPEDLRADDTTSRRYGAACEDCAMKPWCIGLRREYVDVHGDRGLLPFAERPELPEATDVSEQLAIR
jgi:hypothetical protein